MSQTEAVTPKTLAQRALAAAERGNPVEARECLDAIDARAEQGGIPWLIVGQAERMLDEDDRAFTAIMRHLETAPRDLAALLIAGAIRQRGNDDRAASTFYRAALNVANLSDASPAPALIPMLQTAQAFVGAANLRFTSHLERAVEQAGPASARMGAAIDLLLGRRTLYLQQPSMFYFPGLPQRSFYEREEFGWLPKVERALPAMQRELKALIATGTGFAPYVRRSPDQPPPANPLLDDPSWSAQYLWRNGEPVQPTAALCPETMAALSHAPIPVIAGRSPMALFSLLAPNTHIRPHHGLLNTRLICHIPLVAPPNCGLRVGADTRPWHAGKTLIFDDSFEHEAWNQSESIRVVLLFEIWRPELNAAERRALTTVFEAIDDYKGVTVDNG